MAIQALVMEVFHYLTLIFHYFPNHQTFFLMSQLNKFQRNLLRYLICFIVALHSLIVSLDSKYAPNMPKTLPNHPQNIPKTLPKTCPKHVRNIPIAFLFIPQSFWVFHERFLVFHKRFLIFHKNFLIFHQKLLGIPQKFLGIPQIHTHAHPKSVREKNKNMRAVQLAGLDPHDF